MDSNSTHDQFFLTIASTTSQLVPTTPSAYSIHVRRKKAIENAVYGYIQAIRALGRKQVNTVEISEALSLPTGEVNRAVSSLKKKGVKVNA